jgi:hypothetical protein
MQIRSTEGFLTVGTPVRLRRGLASAAALALLLAVTF